VPSSGSCDGCLGSLRCWVCLGVGTLKTRQDLTQQELTQPCPQCGGTGDCPLCQVIDVSGSPCPHAGLPRVSQQQG